MPKFTRRHYLAIAEVFHPTGQQSLIDETERVRLARTLARVFAADNPRFDRERFLSACGVSEEDEDTRKD